MALPWFRFYAEFVHDPKVCTLPEVDQIRLVKLFCLRCSESLDKLDEVEIAFALHIPIEELQKTKRNLVAKGFLTEDWILRNWSKRQLKSDSSTERVRRYRAKETARKQAETDSKRESNGVDIEVDTDKERNTKPNNGGKTTPRLGKVIISEIIDLYHTTLKDLPTVRLPLGQISSRHLRKRVKSFKDGKEIIEHFKEVFNIVAGSDFLTGKTTDWSANFHWIIRPTNHEKILNGEYTTLKEYKKKKRRKLYCTEVGEDYKPLHPVVEVDPENKAMFIYCKICKAPLVEGYILESHINNKRKKALPLTPPTGESGPVSLGDILNKPKAR